MTNSEFEINLQRLFAVTFYIMGFHLKTFSTFYDGSTNKVYSDALITSN